MKTRSRAERAIVTGNSIRHSPRESVATPARFIRRAFPGAMKYPVSACENRRYGLLSYRRRPVSRQARLAWIPAFAGMTRRPRRYCANIYNLMLALFLLLSPALSLAQQRDDFLRPFVGYYDSQSLSTAVGNATVASGQVIPGRSSNPANLGLNRFNHLQINFQHNSFTGPGIGNSNTRLGGAYVVVPVQVYRGSLVFGGGVQRMVDFSNGFQSANKQASEEGGIYATELGASMEVAEDLFIGGAFNYLKGSDELFVERLDIDSLLNPKYSGSSFSSITRVNLRY